MNNQKYWEERAILKDKLLEKDINKLEKKLLKLFKDTRKEVLNELKIIYADIEATEYAKYRIDSLLASVNKALDSLYQKNEDELAKAFIDLYYDFDNEASIDINASFNTINENLIREVLKTEWSGLSFSERIWEHRRKLAFTLKSELKAGLTRGESLQDISKIISNKFDTSFSKSLFSISSLLFSINGNIEIKVSSDNIPYKLFTIEANSTSFLGLFLVKIG